MSFNTITAGLAKAFTRPMPKKPFLMLRKPATRSMLVSTLRKPSEILRNDVLRIKHFINFNARSPSIRGNVNREQSIKLLHTTSFYKNKKMTIPIIASKSAISCGLSNVALKLSVEKQNDPKFTHVLSVEFVEVVKTLPDVKSVGIVEPITALSDGKVVENGEESLDTLAERSKYTDVSLHSKEEGEEEEEEGYWLLITLVVLVNYWIVFHMLVAELMI